jgi:hypothetical protein
MIRPKKKTTVISLDSVDMLGIGERGQKLQFYEGSLTVP